MRRFAALLGIALCLVACGSSRPKLRHRQRQQIQHAQGGAVIAGGCGATSLHRGTFPTWTAPAFSDSSSPRPIIPYGVAKQGDAVAVVFGYPLRAGDPTNPSNKVLWIMRLPRNGSPLTIRARPLAGGGPTVRMTAPADAGPGEIYPSYVNVPRAGCWHLTLNWAGHTDAIDLAYRA